jgi:general secretion pathway protein M
MIGTPRIEALLARFPIAAAAAYLGLLVLFVFMTTDGVLQILQRRDAAVAASEVLQTLETRDLTRPLAARTDVSVPAGSPFLQGASASVAGATLLQRVLAATKRVNGNTTSSQVDLQGPLSKTGFVTATFSLEIDPASLEPLLYDIEAGMPFLFVDNLVVQAPSGSAEGGKLRLVLGVSAQRQSLK